MDSIKADDITMSIVRETKPEDLFQCFEEHKYSVSSPYRGIYYIAGNMLFPMQIVIAKELDWSSHIWLGALSDRLKRQNMVELLENINQISGKAERELADSVLQVNDETNKQAVEGNLAMATENGLSNGGYPAVGRVFLFPNLRKKNIKHIDIFLSAAYNDK